MKRFEKAEEIKVGVIGYGGAFNMGRAHLNEMKKAGMTPVAVSDLDEKRLETAEQDFPGIQTFKSVATMLKKSDASLVTIITPHNTHAKLALQCLNVGKHVVCEKPLAITTEECDAMITAAKKNKVMLSTYHNRHWDGCIMKAVEKIRSGVIGDVVRIEAHMSGYGKPGDWWRTSKSISGGVLYDWGVHLLEYSLQIIDSNLAEVSGYAKNGYWAEQTAWKNDTNEDEGFAVARFTNGKWLALTISSIDSNPKRKWVEVTGTKGSYLFDYGAWELITQTTEGANIQHGSNPASEGWRFYQNVADHLAKGEELVITPEWARRPIHILDLACKSAKKGLSIKAKYK